MVIRHVLLLCKVIVILFISITITSCRERSTIVLSDDGLVSNDSVYLSVVDTVVINIGHELNPVPYISHIETVDGNDYYFGLDNQAIHIYDLNNDSLVGILSLDKLPKLSGLSGFYYSEGKYVVYDYKRRTISVLNDDASLDAIIPIGKSNVIDPWGIAGTSILLHNDIVFLSGPPSYDSKTSSVTSISLNINTKEKILGGFRPDIYDNYFIGYDYLWRVFHTIDDDGNLIISLPASPQINIFDKDMKLKRSFSMRSRYNCDLLEAPEQMTSYDEKLYYLGQHTYGPIEYDPVRKLLYRIATHPMYNIRHGGMTLKPFSIIVATMDGKVISETPIINYDNSMFYDIIASTSRGLYMQVFSEDENKMKFIVFNTRNG